MSTTFTATVSASSAGDAVARVERRTSTLVGLELTGRVECRSERHMLWTVEVEAYEAADADDAWVVLTSYGISPGPELGSRWEQVLGASAR